MSDRESVQTEFIARDVLEHLLNESSMKVNGYTGVHRGKLKDVSKEDPFIKEETFQNARKNIVNGCLFIMRQHGREIEEMCQKLDLEDEQLHANLREVLATIWMEPRNWGRLVSMFVAAYYICQRLYREGRGDQTTMDKIESIVGWLTGYLKAHAVPWIKHRGGYANVFYGADPSHPPKPKSKPGTQPVVEDCKTDYTARAGLLTMAALGLGAVVVGTIVGR